MAKKKQPDFQPKQLRVGRHLPKGRNITNTTFKAKKIITRDQRIKTASENVSLPELLRVVRHKNVSTKIEALKKVGYYIEKNSLTLPSYFTDVLKSVGVNLLEDNGNVRQETIDVINGCLKLLSKSQMNCFMQTLISLLDCMMTHTQLPIKQDSLKLLRLLLNSHPSLICCSIKMLKNLINMISSVRHQKGEMMTPRKRKLDDNINSSITSVEWRDQVMSLVADFLEKLVDSFAKPDPSKDEQKVCWDGLHALHIPLYAGSGLKPKKLEIYSPSQTKTRAQITKELRSFFDDLMVIVSAIVTEELSPLYNAAQGNGLQLKNMQHLNTVTRAVCCLADWYKLGSVIDEEEDPNFLPLMNTLINEKLMKRFPYAAHDCPSKSSVKNPKVGASVHLNLQISYLYTTFIIATEYAVMPKEDRIMSCLCEILSHNRKLDAKSLRLFLKISKSLIENIAFHNDPKPHVGEISEVLGALSDILETNADEETLKAIQCFFIDIALDFDYSFLLECNGMKNWLNRSFIELKFMDTEENTKKHILKFLNQLCVRACPSFLNILSNREPTEILKYLKYKDEDVQFVAMNLITNMVNLPPDFLQDTVEFILNQLDLPSETVIKFIRLLNHRFMDEKVSTEEYMEFATFLFNLGCDVNSIERSEDEGKEFSHVSVLYSRLLHELQEEKQDEQSGKLYDKYQPYEDVFKALSFDCHPICIYRILPPFPDRVKHEKIFEVCLECLLLYPNRRLILNLAINFFGELKETKEFFSVHCSAAMSKMLNCLLNTDIRDIQNIGILHEFNDNLKIAGLFYTSILTNELPKDDLTSLGLMSLETALGCEEDCNEGRNAMSIMEGILSNLFHILDGQVSVKNTKLVLHFLRILKYFITKGYLMPEYICSILPLLQNMQNYCFDNTQERAILLTLYEMAQLQ